MSRVGRRARAWRWGGRTLRCLVPALGLAACRGEPDGGIERAGLSLVATLAGADTVGYARAVDPRAFDFPRDHGPHPGFRTEWWYVTGNVTAESGRPYGFQLTIFRSALAPRGRESASAWATRQAYMGHFTVTDVEGAAFHPFERFARGALGVAGATADPLRVWIDDWVIESLGEGTFPLRVRARADEIEIELDLEPEKPLVLQGDDGLSRKGPEPGNASYYYAYTRLSAAGTVGVRGDTEGVTGTAWLDREWSTSALSEGQVGWDWFALQLDDGWELMIYRMRRADGSADPYSDGVLVDPSGVRVPLAWGRDVVVEETDSWVSPVDGAVYPSGWRVSVPGRGWALDVTPAVADQELALAFRYWEGAVAAEGTGEGGRAVLGRGYVELTGYAGEPPR